MDLVRAVDETGGTGRAIDPLHDGVLGIAARALKLDRDVRRLMQRMVRYLDNPDRVPPPVFAGDLPPVAGEGVALAQGVLKADRFPVLATSRAAEKTRSIGDAPLTYCSPTFVSDTMGVTTSAWTTSSDFASSHSIAMLS